MNFPLALRRRELLERVVKHLRAHARLIAIRDVMSTCIHRRDFATNRADQAPLPRDLTTKYRPLLGNFPARKCHRIVAPPGSTSNERRYARASFARHGDAQTRPERRYDEAVMCVVHRQILTLDKRSSTFAPEILRPCPFFALVLKWHEIVLTAGEIHASAA